MAERGAAVAHCPLSNAYFSAEVFRLREALDRGVKVGLGSDIAGGYDIDIMSSMRHAVAISRMREGRRLMQVAESQKAQGQEGGSALSIDWKESLYLATIGGAQALGLGTCAGQFVTRAPFDAQYSEFCYVSCKSQDIYWINIAFSLYSTDS
jgi:guanine deaminase